MRLDLDRLVAAHLMGSQLDPVQEVRLGLALARAPRPQVALRVVNRGGPGAGGRPLANSKGRARATIGPPPRPWPIAEGGSFLLSPPDSRVGPIFGSTYLWLYRAA